MEQQTFEPFIQIHSHVDTDGILHIEGLHDIANKDVVITTAPGLDTRCATEMDIQPYAASNIGESVAKRMQEIGTACSRLPVLDDRSLDEILGLTKWVYQISGYRLIGTGCYFAGRRRSTLY